MKNFCLTLIAAVLMFSACNHKNGAVTAVNTTANAASAPIMKFAKETHDFGKITSGSTVTYDFNFLNTGKSPLIITDAYASCGCTKPTWPRDPYTPR